MWPIVDYYPEVEQNVETARANYDVGRGDFLNLMQAQRQLVDLRLRHQRTLVDYHRRAAELSRVVGGTLRAASSMEELPLPQ